MWRLVLTLSLWLGAADAVAATAADGGRLDAQLREHLDRMFEDKEYLLDVQLKALPAKPEGLADGPLPGLGFGAATPGDGGAAGEADLYKNLQVDVLLVVDQSVAKERLRLADEVARRLLGGLGLGAAGSLKVKQQPLLRPPPPPLPIPPPPPPPKSLLDAVQEHKDLLIRLAATAWAAAVSLMAVYGVVRRLSAPPAAAQAGGGAPREAGERPAGRDAGAPGTPAGRPKAKTKDELYSKDQALLTQIKDIVAEAGAHPVKVAKVLTRWVALADENARYAALFLRNCDIKTVESIGSALHPADIEKIMRQTIESFDLFSEENQKVLDLMRADLALLSAERVLRERPEPLDFVKNLSEDDVVALVAGEALEVVALVATQIPPHRMQKYYATLDPAKLNRLCTMISTLPSPTHEDFLVVRDVLAHKAEALGAALFDDRGRVQTLVQLLQLVPSPRNLNAVAQALFAANAEVYLAVRPKITLPGDLNHLPARAIAVVTQALDADLLGAALARLDTPFERLAGLLPEVYREVFSDKVRQVIEPLQQDAAWQKVLTTLRELVASGLVAAGELAAARAACDEASRRPAATAGGRREAA